MRWRAARAGPRTGGAVDAVVDDRARQQERPARAGRAPGRGPCPASARPRDCTRRRVRFSPSPLMNALTARLGAARLARPGHPPGGPPHEPGAAVVGRRGDRPAGRDDPSRVHRPSASLGEPPRRAATREPMVGIVLHGRTTCACGTVLRAWAPAGIGRAWSSAAARARGGLVARARPLLTDATHAPGPCRGAGASVRRCGRNWIGHVGARGAVAGEEWFNSRMRFGGGAIALSRTRASRALCAAGLVAALLFFALLTVAASARQLAIAHSPHSPVNHRLHQPRAESHPRASA